MPRFVRVAALTEVPPGAMRAVEADGRRVLLVNVEGRIHALQARCPHRAAPLEEGTLWGAVIECPWHHYRYDARSGENLYPRNVYPDDLPHLRRDLRPLRRYEVRVEGGDIWVRIGGELTEEPADAEPPGDAPPGSGA